LQTVTTDRPGAPARAAGAVPPYPVKTVVAWTLALPVFALFWLLGALVVPAVVGTAPRSGLHFLSEYAPSLAPEPREQARFLLAIAGSVVLAVATWLVLLRLRGAQAPGRAWVIGALAGQAVLVALVAWAWVEQAGYFTYVSSLQGIVSVLAAAAAVWLAVRRPSLPRLPSSRTLVAAGLLVAVALTAAMLLPAVFADRDVMASLPSSYGHVPYTLDEFAAVVAGRTPMVNYVAQYTNVLPYLVAPVFALLGPNVAAFSLAMFALSMVTLLAVLACLRLLVRTWWAALGLYVAFLALTLYPLSTDGPNVGYIGTYYAVMPMRYLGAYLTALACLWALRSPTRVRTGVVGLIAGLALLNNFEFGLPGFGAAVLALACALAADRRALRDAAIGVVAGALLALVGFSVLTLIRSGQLPDVLSLTYFSRQFGAAGFYMLPVPRLLGLHAIIYATFAACVVLGFVRGLRRSTGPEERVTTGLLTFSGVFGMGALAYYVGRSHPEVLVAVFGAWALALCVLGVCAWRALRAAPPRSLTVALLVVPASLVFGHVALAASTLTDNRALTRQPDRLLHVRAPEILREMPMQRAVRACTVPDETLAILSPLGQRVAAETGRTNVALYNHPMSMATQEQLDALLKAIDDNNVDKVLAGQSPVELWDMLRADGFRQLPDQPGEVGVERWAPYTTVGLAISVWVRGPARCTNGADNAGG
jgi:hypothetical protein